MIWAVVSLSLSASGVDAMMKAERCANALRPAVTSDSARPVQIDDLVHLRDIGGPADVEAPFSLSPDRRTIALIVRRADAERNDYCQGLFLVDLHSRRVRGPVIVGGGPILSRYDLPNMPDFSGGVIETNVPRWSPDGRWIAYLERRDGIVQIMRVSVEALHSEQLSHSQTDIREFEWDAGGREIHFTARGDQSSSIEALAAEGQRGYRFDERWMPEWGFKPFPAFIPSRRFAIAVASGAITSLPQGEDGMVPPGAVASARDEQGALAAIYFQARDTISGPKRITVTISKGQEYHCDRSECSRARSLWWQGRDTLLFSIEAGWGGGQTEIFSWDFGRNKLRRLISTVDRLNGCQPTHNGLLCAIDGAAQPRRLVLIDYETGDRTTIFDPNPEWQTLTLGQVRRLQWRNDIGLEAYGDLVLPPGATTSGHLPLVIVGYQTRGFLRGGTGDLFPVFPLAARGFAVLVYNRPQFFGYLRPVKDQAEADRRGFENWADKKSGVSSIMTALEMLVADGTVDPARVGLTGFSDGVDKATYALIHHDVFRAVSMAACCSDPILVNASIGPYLADVANAAGYPAYRERTSERARQYSLAANAANVRVPIMIQAADREYMHSLEVEAAFRQEGRPLALYIFPDEYHNFWQPAHRQAAYARNIDWFDYYLLRDGKGELPALLRPSNATPHVVP